MAKRKQSKAKEEKGEVQAGDEVQALLGKAADALAAFEENESEVTAEEIESLIEQAEEEAFDQDEDGISASEEEGPAPEILDEINDSELGEFDAAEIETKIKLDPVQIDSIVESFLFANDRPVSLAQIRQIFKGTTVRSSDLRKCIDRLKVDYADAKRGVVLEEVASGYQLRTKIENRPYLRGQIRAKIFRVSGQALEVLSIVAYKQPCIKMNVDEIRGVESGHLLRALMEKGLVQFAGKSELPGKPMLYETTRKFLEIFGLRNLGELPSLTEIDELIPEGIGDLEEDKESLGDITDSMSQELATTYSEGEAELMDISAELKDITTTTDFFEREKARMKAEDDRKRAEDIRQTLALGAELSDKDRRFLEKYDKAQAEIHAVAEDVTPEGVVETEADVSLQTPVPNPEHGSDPTSEAGL